MEIIQSFYYSSNKERHQEIEITLNANLSKHFVKKIHIFIEENDYNIFKTSHFSEHEKYGKINIVLWPSQPTYPELFKYSSKLENVICCVCNSDIEIFIENDMILNNLNNNKIIYFITRHEWDGTKPLIDNYGGSHDAFVFHSDTLKTHIKNKDLGYINYIQNTPGIEALLTIYFIEQLEYEILNPCFQIKLVHHHESNVRLWNQQYKKPVGYTSQKPNGIDAIHNKHIISPCNLTILNY
jgi:hypothetical protein